MKEVSAAWHRALVNDERAWVNEIRVHLVDIGKTLMLNNSDLWMDGLTIDDAVSDDSDFQVGTAIVNRLDLTINNIHGAYSGYNFLGADVFVKIGLQTDEGLEQIIKGRYWVNNAVYNGSLIKLECLDYMSNLDIPYSEVTTVYRATLEEIVDGICDKCDMNLACRGHSARWTAYKNTYIETRPADDDKISCREVVAWIAQLIGCYAKIITEDTGGLYLTFQWYDQDALNNVTSGLDGGIFDGIAVGSLTDYFNTETGMTTLSSSTSYDTWFSIDNSIGFIFNGETFDKIYIGSDSCFKFANEEPTTSGQQELKDVNICVYKGESSSIKYQEIAFGDNNAIKIRFSGYTQYSRRTSPYALTYEIFFVDNGQIVMNFITIPTTTSEQFGQCKIIEGASSTPFVPSTTPTVFEREDGTWIGNPVANTYQTGDTADGGSFNPWNTGDVADGGLLTDTDNVHFISSLYSRDISLDDVIITGVNVEYKTGNNSNAVAVESVGTSDYVVTISNNPFINSTNANTIANRLLTLLTGLRFRKASISHASDPSIDAGDVAVVFDAKGNAYPILISRTTFSISSAQSTVSSAQTPAHNASLGYSVETRNYVELSKNIDTEVDAVNTRITNEVATINQAIANANGLYLTTVEDQTTHAVTYYLHDKGDSSQGAGDGLSRSDIRIQFSDLGIMVTANGTAQTPTWYGLTTSGNMLTNLLSAKRIEVEDNSGYKLRLTSGGSYIVDPNDNVLAEYSSLVRLISSDSVSMLQLENNGIKVFRAKEGQTLSNATYGIRMGTSQGRAKITQFLGTLTSAPQTFTITTSYTFDPTGEVNIYFTDTGEKVGSGAYTRDGRNITITNAELEGKSFEVSFYVTDFVGYSLSVGENNTFGSSYSSAFGYNASATGFCSTAFGKGMAKGDYSVAYGYGNVHNAARYSVAFGSANATGVCCVAQGENTEAYGTGSHSEGGDGTYAFAAYSHAEGRGSDTSGLYSHSEGEHTNSVGTCSHAEGHYCRSVGTHSHAEGYGGDDETDAVSYGAKGSYSHSEGYKTTANGMHSHSEGDRCIANSDYSHSEGTQCQSTASYSHSEGKGCIASGQYSHSEGEGCTASAQGSHATGYYTEARGNYCYTSGHHTMCDFACATVIGKYNDACNDSTASHSSLGTYPFVIGNGTSGSRSDALRVTWEGNVRIAGSYLQISDKRLKEHISYLDDDAVEFVRGLKPVHFKKDDKDHVGFYAQDVEEIDKWNCMVGEMNNYKSLGYIELIAPLVKYCQKLEERISELEKIVKEKGDV